jgi:MOSC domain-containing protein YiiM
VRGIVVSINISSGGVPKYAVNEAQVTIDGLVGDGHAHAKHIKPTRALSLLDEEILETLRHEGYPVAPGVLGENITVRSLHVQGLTPGAILTFSGGVVIELVEPRKPCFVLKEIHEALEKETIGRIGYMARVIKEGTLHTGEQISVSPVTPSLDL